MPMLKKGFHVVALDLPGDWFDWLLFLGFCWLGLGGSGSRKG